MLASLLVALAHADEPAWTPSASLAIDATRAHATNGGDAQVEIDLAREGDDWSVDVQLDLHLDPFSGDLQTPWLPENATATVALGPTRLTAGALNPMMGLEEWDSWSNYLPSYSAIWDGAQPGRVAGANLAMDAGPGEAFVYGGTDLDWGWPVEDDAAPTFGAGYTAETDAWSTWSGVAAYPSLQQYGAFVAAEAYVGDALTVALDGGVGSTAGSLWQQAQLYVVGLPNGIARPTVRVEGIHDGDGVLGATHTLAASAGVKLVPTPWLVAAVEARATQTDGAWSLAPVGVLALTYAPASDD